MSRRRIVRSRLRLPLLRSLTHTAFLIYDRRLEKRPAFRRWCRTFPRRYAVTAGEQLKAIETFPAHISRIVRLTADIARRRLTVVVVGGGSTLDFGGFVASILKRGVHLVLIPSTWLAAIDAAHGGKTALNVNGAKNQIGTFHTPRAIYIVKELLLSQPQARARDAMAELVKIALIDGRRLKGVILSATKDLGLWSFLPSAIRAKNRVVARDPREENGARQVLNLGHTLGHVLEAHFKMAHGVAVAHGLRFALQWSRRRYGRPLAGVDALLRLLPRGAQPERMPEKKFMTLAARDKKRTRHDRLSFVFLRRRGQPVRSEVTLTEFLGEARRQGWVR